jgi:hypothetical protein
MEVSTPPESIFVKDPSTSKKRGRNEAFDESYIKNKRMLQEGFKSLTLQAEPQPNVQKETEEFPTYGLYEIHKCPSHELFRADSECSCIEQNDNSGDGRVESNSLISFGPLIKKQNSLDSIISHSTESDEDFSPGKMDEREVMVSMIKGGKRKFVRKVDYLVDELIRKTRKTNEIPAYSSDSDSILPAFVGPSPRTDHAISIIVPFSTNFCSLSKQQQFPLIGYTETSSEPPQPVLLSGEVTHSDWGIEEVGGAAKCDAVECNSLIPYSGSDQSYSTVAFGSGGDQEADDNDSDVACCDDESSHRYSTNSSIISGDSGMIVDSDDDDLMAGSGRSFAFDESSSAFGKFEQGRYSPFSSNTSIKTIMTRSAIDDEEDVVNIGTF